MSTIERGECATDVVVKARLTRTSSWSPIIDFLDDQHENYMRQEQQPQRKEKVDLRVHACLYFIRPTGHT